MRNLKNDWQFEEKLFLLELQAGRLRNDIQYGKKEVVMHGSLNMTWRSHAQNCCEEIYRPTGLNLRPMCAGFHRLLQSMDCPNFSLLTKLCEIERVWIRFQIILYTVWVLLIAGRVQEKFVASQIEGYNVLSQEIQSMGALIIIALWDRIRPPHSLILVRIEVYWFISQNDKNRIMISYAHITLILIMPTT